MNLYFFRKLVYVAFETNSEALEYSKNKLKGLGFHETDPKDNFEFSVLRTGRQGASVPLFSYELNLPTKNEFQPMEIQIYLIPLDFTSQEARDVVRQINRVSSATCRSMNTNQTDTALDDEDLHHPSSSSSVDLIIGCCVADLIPPNQLLSNLLELSDNKDCIVYLPITFSGTTEVTKQIISIYLFLIVTMIMLLYY